MIGLVAAGRLDELTEYLAIELDRIAAAGATIGMFASNTPHIVFDALRARSSIPLISIVDETCAVAKAQRLRTLGIFGTRFTMSGRFYPDVFERDGMKIVAPAADEQEYIHEKYMNELVAGRFLDETRGRLLSIADRLIRELAIDGLILAGTELPLILTGDRHRNIPLLNTTRIHVHAVIARMD